MDLDYGATAMAFDSERGHAFNADDKLIVNFRMQPHLNKKKTSEEGRPIYESREYVTIIVPGDKNNIVNCPVWEQHRQRFPRQYAAFKAGQTQELSGTPLEHVAWITREQVEELKFFHIRTLEQLSNCPDVHAQKFMGINKLRQRARDHIQQAKEAAPLEALAQTKRENEEMKKLIQQLNDRIEALETAEQED